MQITRAAVHSFAQSWWAVGVIALLMAIILYQRWDPTHRVPTHILRIGEHLEPEQLETLERKAFRLDWKSDARPTVVYTFSPGCIWSRRNAKAVQALMESASPRYRVICVSLTRDGLREYLNNERLGCPVYVAGPGASISRSGVTPDTLVVSSDGTVMKVWHGAYGPKVAPEIEEMFGTQLPVVQW